MGEFCPLVVTGGWASPQLPSLRGAHFPLSAFLKCLLAAQEQAHCTGVETEAGPWSQHPGLLISEHRGALRSLLPDVSPPA